MDVTQQHSITARSRCTAGPSLRLPRGFLRNSLSSFGGEGRGEEAHRFDSQGACRLAPRRSPSLFPCPRKRGSLFSVAQTFQPFRYAVAHSFQPASVACPCPVSCWSKAADKNVGDTADWKVCATPLTTYKRGEGTSSEARSPFPNAVLAAQATFSGSLEVLYPFPTA
jgi:hypothetical protein